MDLYMLYTVNSIKKDILNVALNLNEDELFTRKMAVDILKNIIKDVNTLESVFLESPETDK